MSTTLESIFAAEGLRLTHPRRSVFAAMRSADEPVTAQSIAKRCEAIDRTSVYRTLEVFVRLGIAQAVPTGWKRRYELAAPFKAHHHHLTCTGCGKLIDIHSNELEDLMSGIARDYGFTPTGHTFEIRGTCDNCR